MNKEQIYEAIGNPFILDQSTLASLTEVVRECPFFDLGWMLLMKNLRNVDSVRYDSELRKAAVHVHNRSALYKLVNLKPKPVVSPQTEPQPVKTDTTRQPAQVPETTDYFADETAERTDDDSLFGYSRPAYSIDDIPDDNDAHERTFIEWLNNINSRPADDVQQVQHNHNVDLIDAFLDKLENNGIRQPERVVDPAEANRRIEASSSENEGTFTETLAQIYIKQRQYEKALNIFRKLSLKNTEKRTYFATRIAEIEKLID